MHNILTSGVLLLGLGLPFVAIASPQPDILTVVYTAEQLAAWAANPVTPVEVRAPISLGSADFVVTTNCRFSTTDAADLTGSGDFVLTAAELDLGGDVSADEVRLSASDAIVIRKSARIESEQRTHILGPGALDLRGTVYATDIEIFVGSAKLRSSANLNANGNLNIDGGALLDVNADLHPSGTLNLYGDSAILRSRCMISPEYAFIDIAGHLDFRADLSYCEEVEIEAGSLIVRQIAQLQGGYDLSIDIEGDFALHGDIFAWYDVSIAAATYRLYRTHQLQALFDCEISGVADPKSLPATGCN